MEIRIATAAILREDGAALLVQKGAINTAFLIPIALISDSLGIPFDLKI